MKILKRKIRKYAEMSDVQRHNFWAEVVWGSMVYGTIYLSFGWFLFWLYEIETPDALSLTVIVLIATGAAVSYAIDGVIYGLKRIAALVAPKVKEWAYRD